MVKSFSLVVDGHPFTHMETEKFDSPSKVSSVPPVGIEAKKHLKGLETDQSPMDSQKQKLCCWEGSIYRNDVQLKDLRLPTCEPGSLHFLTYQNLQSHQDNKLADTSF